MSRLRKARDKAIIIVGSGRAALLHLQAYLRMNRILDEEVSIYVIAGDFVASDLEQTINIANGKARFIKTEDLKEIDRKSSLIDICTSTSNHLPVIEAMMSYGFSKFLVEKPIVTTQNELETIRSLGCDIAVMENYLFSQATKKAVNYIKKEQMVPRSVLSFFCKDRTKDAEIKRGFDDGIAPHVYTIEMPHQLYLTSTILSAIQIIGCYAQSMHTQGNAWSGHGAGAIILKGTAGSEQNECRSEVFSCMFSQRCVRQLIIEDWGKKKLVIDYANNSFQVSKLTIYEHKNVVSIEEFKNDDMLGCALEYYWESLILDGKLSREKYLCSLSNAALVISALDNYERNDSAAVREDDVCFRCCSVCKERNIVLPCSIVS